MLALNDLSKNYGALRVADGITLSVAKGEALGVVGPNGAGKTTLFNLVTGTVRASRGTVSFNGENISALPAATRCRRGIARSFQVPQPFGGMTVFENVVTAAMFGRGMEMKAARRRAIEVLAETRLLHHAERPAGALPLLDRKRLELSRALATEPELLLLDEIAGGLTDQECGALTDLITRINRNNTVTVIWIEHVVHALLAVVRRLIVLDQGRVVMDGEPGQVMSSSLVRELYMGAIHG